MGLVGGVSGVAWTAENKINLFLSQCRVRIRDLIFAFLIFYRVRPLTESDKKRAKTEWGRFKKGVGKDVAIVGEYAHIWGTTYNGMIIVESRDLSAFHDFWHRFREATRWYVPETKTFIAQREE